MTCEPALKDGEKVAESHERRLVYGPFTLPPSRCRGGEKGKERRAPLPFPVHM